jgi:uncharacterized DUF497 family protein
MEFGWDPAKHEKNLQERGFGFDYAARIFEGPTIEAADNRREYGETRVKAIGSVEGRVITVIYTDRPGLRWIITAWPASRQERRIWRSHAPL